MEGIWQDYPTKVSILEAIALAGKDAARPYAARFEQF